MATIAAIAAGVASAAAAASSIKGMVDGPPGSGGSGGGGLSPGGGLGSYQGSWSGGQNPQFQNMNLASAYANSLFDPAWESSQLGGLFKGTGTSIQDYLRGGAGTSNDLFSQARGLLNQTQGNFQQTQDLFRNVVLPGITNVATTGLRQDIGPIKQQRQNEFWQDYFPQLKEKMQGQTGTFSTDFLSNMDQEQRRLLTELGVLDYNAGEAAAGRQAAALPVAGNLGIVYSGLPSATARDWMSGISASDPGMRAIDVLSKMSGIASQGQYVQPGYNPAGSEGANSISSLAGAIPGIGSALSGLSGLFTGGGGGSGLSSTQAYTNMFGSGGNMGGGQNLFYQPGALQSSLGW